MTNVEIDIEVVRLEISLKGLQVETTASATVSVRDVSIEISLAPPRFSTSSTIPLPFVPLEIRLPIVLVDAYTVKRVRLDRRYQRSAWQARLGKKLDTIRQKVTDNSLLLTSHPTDMVRIRAKRDERTHDLISRVVESVEVLPIVLPILKDVPMRRLLRQQQEITSFEMISRQPFEIYSPVRVQLKRDDLLFRMIYDPQVNDPYVMVLQIKDELATMAYSSLLYIKYTASFYDEKIPLEVVQALVAATQKREALTW